MSRRGWIPRTLALLGLAILPLAADRLRSQEERCALDGVEIAHAFRTHVVDADGLDHAFCGVRCARLWVERQERPPRSVWVTDCASGRELDATSAWYVHALTTRTDGAPDSIRTFATLEEARRFVEAYGGELFLASQRPFLAHPPAGDERETSH